AVVDPRMQGQVKITVIATGFERASVHRDVAASATPTPVDLSSYTARKQESTERIAAAGGGGSRMPITINRRATFELPLMVANGSNEGDQGDDFEASPLDVPAFLRRQND